jgi:hypothetical protein
MSFINVISILVILSGSTFLIIKLPIFRRTGLNIKWRLGLYALKLIASLGIIALYSWYYPKSTADIYKYFNDGKAIYETSGSTNNYLRIVSGIGTNTDEIQNCLDGIPNWNRKYLKGVWNDNRTIIRFNALLYPLTGGSIIAHSFLMAFLSFFGLTLLYLGTIKFTRGSPWLAIAVFMVPNVWLWSSGLLKEALLMLNVGILFYAISNLHFKFSLKYILLLLFGVGLFFLTKMYVLVCLIPAMIFLLTSRKRKHLFLHFIMIHIVIALLFFFSGIISPRLDFMSVMDRKQQDFINMVDASENVGSKIEVPNIEHNIFDIIKKSPKGFSNCFFRPHPLEFNSPVMAFAGIENLTLLFLLIYAFIRPAKINREQLSFLLFSLSFIIILYTITGLTTPVLGALVRYKIPALPFFAASIFILGKWDLRKPIKSIN